MESVCARVYVRINEKVKNIMKDLYLYIMRSRSIDGISLALALKFYILRRVRTRVLFFIEFKWQPYRSVEF